MNAMSKIGLGTAQWGMVYGIANRTGKPDETEIKDMLTLARQRGVTLLDTAYAYGEAEKTLGRHNPCTLGFEIVTKTKLVEGSNVSKKDVTLVVEAFTKSLKKLNSEHVYGLLVHHSKNLLEPGGNLLWAKLQELKAKMLVSKIGVSVYHPRELDAIFSRYDIDLVQAPFNIYDQRFIRKGLFERLKKKGVEIHTRSAFLQGLLLMKPEELPAQFGVIRDHQAKLHNEFRDLGFTPLEACLGYCLNQTEIDRVILGCETMVQLTKILDVVQKCRQVSLMLEPYSVNNEKIVDPSVWIH